MVNQSNTVLRNTSRKARASNIELLRIFSMLLVLLLHYVATIPIDAHSLKISLLDSLTIIEINSLSVVCVHCFILISGYFSIRWKPRSIISLVYQVVFWLLVGIAIAYRFSLGISESWLDIIYKYFGSRWFVQAYICLYLLAPLLNTFIDNCDVKKLGRYILLFYMYSTVIGYICKSAEFNEGMSALSLIGLYMIGAYLRRTTICIFHFKPKTDLVVFLGLSVSLTFTRVILLYLGITVSPIGYLNPIVIIMSIYLFLFFQKLKIKSIRWINFVAASAFAVFLFHKHPLLYETYQVVCKRITQTEETIIYLPIFFLIIFIVSIMIDRVRIASFNIIWKRLSNIFERH